ncbi:MAG TPA: LLM class F420-dependent oxidoreductase [bacterium]|nr:LLM class F420-dependent oxidoreductase [bacterium]
MRLGFVLPQIGVAAGPQSVASVAQRVETLGYDSVWVTDRLLFPLTPQTPYPATPDGALPEPYKRVLDPLETLTFVAGHTKRIALGTSVLDMPFYNPVVLARRLTTLDVLSGGRLRVGLGQGWSKDEYEAAGISARGLGKRADEFLLVLKAIWTADPVEFHGHYFHVPKSIIQPKPVQKPHPPLYLAAYSPRALQRVATQADGWNPVGIPVEGMKLMMEGIRETARAAGRDSAALQMVVRANLFITPQPVGNDRWIFSGTLAQIKADVEAVRVLGASEIFFDATFSPGMKAEGDFIRVAEELRRAV